MYTIRRLYKNKNLNYFIFGPINSHYVNYLFGEDKPHHFDYTKKIIYLNFNVLLLFIKNFIIIKTKNYNFFSRARYAYALSLIHFLNPKKVITIIDNSAPFEFLALNGNSARDYISIQNGVRWDEYNTSINDPHSEKIFFGKYDLDNYSEKFKKYGKYHLYGSFKEYLFRSESNIYKEFLSKKIIINNDTVCIVSDNWNGWNHKIKDIEDKVGMIYSFCYSFVDNNNLKLKILLKHGYDQKSGAFGVKKITEVEFISRYIDTSSSRVELHYDPENQWSNYEEICKSSVTIGTSSTLMLESASRKCRVLILDIDSKISMSIPYPLSLSIDKGSYNLFSKELKKIRSQSDEEYWASRKDISKYFMSDSHYSSKTYLKEIINI